MGRIRVWKSGIGIGLFAVLVKQLSSPSGIRLFCESSNPVFGFSVFVTVQGPIRQRLRTGCGIWTRCFFVLVCWSVRLSGARLCAAGKEVP